MKTSNKLLIGLALVLFIGMTSFNVLLKEEYIKAKKQSILSSKVINLQAFTQLTINSNSHFSNIVLQEGIGYSIKNISNAKVVNGTLLLDTLSNTNNHQVIITVPILPKIDVHNTNLELIIEGKNTKFSNNHLIINSVANGNIYLKNCQLASLKIKTDNEKHDNTRWSDEEYMHFHLNDSNIENADILLKGKSSLTLKNTVITMPMIALSDSAQVVVEGGNALNSFQKK